MTSPHLKRRDSTVDPSPSPLNTWVVQDTHIRKVQRFEGHPLDPKSPTGSNNNTELEALEKEAAALQLALDASRKQEHDRQAVMEQRRLEMRFKDKKEREREREKEKEKERVRERERMELELKLKLEQLEKEKEKELRRATEETLYRERERNKERVFREQAARMHEAEVRKHQMKKVWELEDAAVKRAVEDSIVTEAAREIVREREERERKRIEKERVKMEREAKRSQEERLRQLRGVDEEQRHWGWEEGVERIWVVDEGIPLGGRVGESVRAHVGDEIKPTGTESYSMRAENNTTRLLDPLPEPTWYPQSPVPRPTIRQPYIERGRDTQGYRRWDHEANVGRYEETDADRNVTWGDEYENTRRWGDATTERWETFVRREEGQNGYRRYREVSRTGRGYR